MSMLKKLGLATLTATLVAGSVAVALAEGNVSGAGSSPTSSPTLQADYATTHGNTVISGPSASMNSYGYAREEGLNRSHKPARNKAQMKHHN
jgi:hypothetical protein